MNWLSGRGSFLITTVTSPFLQKAQHTEQIVPLGRKWMRQERNYHATVGVRSHRTLLFLAKVSHVRLHTLTVLTIHH